MWALDFQLRRSVFDIMLNYPVIVIGLPNNVLNVAKIWMISVLFMVPILILMLSYPSSLIFWIPTPHQSTDSFLSLGEISKECFEMLISNINIIFHTNFSYTNSKLVNMKYYNRQCIWHVAHDERANRNTEAVEKHTTIKKVVNTLYYIGKPHLHSH